MTTRGLVVVWASALVFFVVAAIGLDRIGDPAWPTRDVIGTAEVAVIGTSLMVHAIPVDPVPNGILGDGRRHRRLAYNDMPERDAVAILRGTFDTNVRTVVIELAPLAYDLAHRFRFNAQNDRRWQVARIVEDLSQQLHRGLKHLGGQSEFESKDPTDLQRTSGVVNAALRDLFYPLHLRKPREWEALRSAVAQARARGIEIILVAPPRAETAEGWIGPETERALATHMTDLAQALALPLFHPGPAWPNDLFVDNAHLNAQGRARFCTELAAWYRSAR